MRIQRRAASHGGIGDFRRPPVEADKNDRDWELPIDSGSALGTSSSAPVHGLTGRFSLFPQTHDHMAACADHVFVLRRFGVPTTPLLVFTPQSKVLPTVSNRM